MNSHSELLRLNWDFAGESGAAGLANYHWYPGRFVPQLAGLLVGNLTRPGDTVLDPFCGSGTTLVEAYRLGRQVCGIDVNPVAGLIARSKLLNWNEALFAKYVADIRCAIEGEIRRSLMSQHPVALTKFPENIDWYHPETLEELSIIWSSLETVKSPYEVVGQVTFSSILRFASSQDNHWGWICDNVKPKTFSRKAAIRPFLLKLEQYAVDAAEISHQRATFWKGVTASNITTGPCQEVLEGWESNSIDAVVTSPPYYSMNDYSRSQRLSFIWLGYDLDTSRAKESGARYKRHRKTARAQYLSDMKDCFNQIYRVLKPGAYCAVVVGESPNRESYLEDFQLIMLECGFVSELIRERRVPLQRAMSPQVKEELIMIFHKKN